MGWFGGQAEWYFDDERFSVFGGLGYTPEIEPGDPSGVTFAAGLRRFTPGLRHRAFLELSVSQLAVLTNSDPEYDGRERFYGPGLQLGYQFTAVRGFTLLVSGGFGYALGFGDIEPDSAWGSLLGLGIGGTWR